jgi:hypothetical protein
VEVTPKTLARKFAVIGKGIQPQLIVELQRGVGSQDEPVRLKVGFRIPHAAPTAARAQTLDFPVLRPLGPVSFQGSMGISVDPSFHATILQAKALATVTEPGPWGKSPLSYFFTFRDQPPSGKLRLLLQPPQFQATCFSQIVLTPKKGELLTRLQLLPGTGMTEHIDIWSSARLSGKLLIEPASDQLKITGVERMVGGEAAACLAALGGQVPLGATALLPALPQGELWRIKLEAPLSHPASLLLRTTLAPINSTAAIGGEALDWEIPVFQVVGALSTEGKLGLEAAGVKIIDTQMSGLKAVPASSWGSKHLANDSQHRSFLLSETGASMPRLSVHTQNLPRHKALPKDQFDQAQFVTYAGAGGQLTHQFFFRVRDWEATTLPVELPGAARILYAKRQGKWVEQLAEESADGARRVELPTDPGAKWQWFEIAYTTQSATHSWLLWTQVSVESPRLPAPPLVLQRFWKLPSGIVPLDEGRYLPVDQPAAAVGDSPSWWFAAERLAPWLNTPAAGPGWETVQRHDLLEALQLGRKDKSAYAGRLDVALIRLSRNLPARATLVLDVAALQAAGVFAQTTVVDDGSIPFWEKIGLTHVPIPGAVFFTTKEQARLLAEEKALHGAGKLAYSVEAAARFGQDPSGRLQTVWTWVNQPNDPTPVPMPAWFGWSKEPGWTEWSPAPGTPTPETIVLIQRENLTLMSWLLAVVIGVLLWRLGRHLPVAWKFRVLLIWMALAGACLAIVPLSLRDLVGWPVLIGLVVTLGNFFIRMPVRTAARRASLSVAVLLMLLAGIALLAPAVAVGQGKAFTVFITGPVDKQQALVPTALLQKLQQLSEPEVARLPDAVVVSANYQGNIKEDWAEIQADFLVHCFRDDVVLTLPLKGVQLLPDRDTKVDNEIVYPLPAGAAGGYTVPIRGHKDRLAKLSLTFKTRVQIHGTIHEINCSIPRQVQSELTLTLPADAQSVRAVTALGRQQLTQQGGLRLTAELGTADAVKQGESQLWVRWIKPPAQQKVEVDVSEYHLGDLRPFDVRPDKLTGLTSVLRYKITQGAVSRFELLLPEHLQPRSIDVRLPEEKSPQLVPIRVASWKVIQQPGSRILEVNLDTPVTGMAQLTASFVPTNYSPHGPSKFLLPTPLGARSQGGLLGYLTELPTVPDKGQLLSITPFDAQDFAIEWLSLGMPTPSKPDRSYRFQRQNPKALAGLDINAAGGEPRISQEIDWLLHPNYSRLSATLNLSDTMESTYLEWEVPAALTVANLSSPSLLRWSKSTAGSKKILQIWLLRGGATTVTLTGWLAQPVKSGPFALPRLALAFPGPCPTTVRVGGVKGLSLRPGTAKNMTAMAAGPAGITYVANKSDYAATALVETTLIKPQVQILTIAERLEAAVRVTSLVHCTIPAGELQKLTLLAQGWNENEPQLNALRIKKIQRHVHDNQNISWTLHLQPGTTGQYTLKITGTIPLGDKGEVRLPTLAVAEAEATHDWVAMIGPHLQVGSAKSGLAPDTDPMTHLTAWPLRAEQIQEQGQLWSAVQKDWQLSIMPGSAPPKKTVQVLFAESSLAPAGTASWIHQTEYLLTVQDKSPVHLLLPSKARLLTVFLDGKQIPVEFADLEEILVASPTAPGPRQLLVRWTLSDHTDFHKPDLRLPKLLGADVPPMLLTVQIPPGSERVGQLFPAGLTTLSPGAAWLYRAAAQLQRSEFIAAGNGTKVGLDQHSELERAQQMFYWCCGQARQCLANAPSAAQEAGPQNQSLDEWRAQLEAENQRLAKDHQFEALRQRAEKEPIPTANEGVGFSMPGQRGTPAQWLIAAAAQPVELSMTLNPVPSTQSHAQLVQLLLVVVLAGMMLSFVPGGVWLVRALWPEELCLVMVVGMVTYGTSFLALALMAWAIGFRVVWLARRAGKLLHRPAAPANPPAAS